MLGITVLLFAFSEMGSVFYRTAAFSWYLHLYFILSSEFNAYLKQIKVILSTVKPYRIFSLVTNMIYIFQCGKQMLLRQFRA